MNTICNQMNNAIHAPFHYMSHNGSRGCSVKDLMLETYYPQTIQKLFWLYIAILILKDILLIQWLQGNRSEVRTF